MEEQKTTPSLAEALGRRAGRFVKKARPAIERAASEAVPRLQKSGREALEFAKGHEDEIRDAATKLARARMRGPLGMFVDAVTANPMAPRSERASTLVCPACSAGNPPAARFCNQCGGAVQRAADEQGANGSGQ